MLADTPATMSGVLCPPAGCWLTTLETMLARSRNNVVRERNAIPCRFAEIADRVSDSSRELIVHHVVPISFSTSRARARPDS